MTALVPLTLALLQAGAPAPTFQQGVDYRIEATLDEAAQVLRGRARLRYTNNVPDRLDTLYVHQHLNAFRPNSAWARRELQFRERRFQDLGPAEHAFERFTRITVDGRSARAVYPGAPDSTVAAIVLPAPLRPGGTMDVVMDWEARPSTVPRRQGRDGRHWDFAQWYPRIAVYGSGGWAAHPLMPQGEFFGEFATYDVTLDVAADQILGATGVPVEGDPGWERVVGPVSEPVRLRRDAYPPPRAESLGMLEARPADGRKRVRWRAQRVHHFAWSADPEFRYEGGRLGDVAIHVLYRPGDLDWDLGAVVRRSIRALGWLDEMFGPYPYPQLTILHRLEGGGTEFPMLVMNGGDGQGLIAHEVTHQYAHGIFANNEWRDAWLDEGFTSFLTNWFFEAHGAKDVWRPVLERAARWPAELQAQPVATPSADFVNFQTYGAMSYTKGSIVFYMLRELIGAGAFRDGLQRYYACCRLAHVTEADIRRVMTEASGRDLDWFFDQWLHTTHRLDYAVGDVSTVRLADGRWRTRVDVRREGEAWMPVVLEVGSERLELASRERRQVVEVTTTARPAAVTLDPDVQLLETNRANNRRALEP